MKNISTTALLTVALASSSAMTPAFALALPTQEEVAMDLEQYKWEKRVLLIFADSDSEELAEQMDILNSSKAGNAERDLEIIQLSRGVPAHQSLFNSFQIDGDFTLLLLGKDGGEKLRSKRVLPSSKLYKTIDAMPMRALEMYRNK